MEKQLLLHLELLLIVMIAHQYCPKPNVLLEHDFLMLENMDFKGLLKSIGTNLGPNRLHFEGRSLLRHKKMS